ncbi:hypothetical protein Ancab_022925 [Ancistrocladus abbreviatus]
MAYNGFKPMSIPPEFGELKMLKFFWMTECNLVGEIPESFGSLYSLEHLDLVSNNLNGSIPTGLFQLKNLSYLYLYKNWLSGEIPRSIQALNLTEIDLSNNNLTGPIPDDLGKLQELTILKLFENSLSGGIPDSLGRLPNLKQFNLFHNNLNGVLPPELGMHSKLEAVQVCSNQLSGRLPENLCAGGALQGVVAFSNKLTGEIPKSLGSLPDKVSWNLTRLEIDNLIGSGGSGKVYRIEVRSGDAVAVKRIWNNRKLNDAQFIAEVQILGTIRHSNIVKLLCCISSEESKLLVYEYMENESLDRWLHGKKRGLMPSTMSNFVGNILDWPTRLRIAIGAARGLCYMHHDCSPPIIHRDVKSSNILLDSEFNAKIADFGLAKMSLKPGQLHTVSNVAGSFGYLAPEYGYMTKVNEKIDVYSFGVVLLELTTGKEPNSIDDNMNLADWAWKHYSKGHPIDDVLDKEIKEQCFLEEMSNVFKLGLMCTSTLPSSRPSMKEVLQVLCRFSQPS